MFNRNYEPRVVLSFEINGIPYKVPEHDEFITRHCMAVPDRASPVERVKRPSWGWDLIEYSFDDVNGIATCTYERILPADESNEREIQVATVQYAQPQNRGHGWWLWFNGKRTALTHDSWFE